MHISITLEDTDGPEEAKRAMSLIGYFMGPETMAKLAGEFKANLMTTTAVAPPPPPPPPPPPADEEDDEEEQQAPAPTGAAVELDSTGLPWDARIHSATKNKTKPGAFKFIKGLDDNVKMAVMAELRAKYPAPAAGTPAAAAPPPPPPPPPAGQPGELPQFLDRRETAPPPPPPAGGAGAPAGGYTFVTLMQRITEGLGNNKLTKDDVANACKSAGLTSAAELGMPANAVHIPTVAAFIDATMAMK